MNARSVALTLLFCVGGLVILSACSRMSGGEQSSIEVATESAAAPPKPSHLDEVMTSRFCGNCHTAIYAEHAMNTHGRAFTDEEVRLGTGRFDHGDCIRCHTPRPVFETGMGMNPLRRFHNLEEGNTCMTCHWKQDVDYASFQGGKDCVGAFDPRAGEVEACATCHRNHGTPYQWEIAPTGKLAGNECIDCHMETISRPISKDGPVRETHSHLFPGSRSDSQVRRAYRYEVSIDGNEAVVRVTNKGAGHHFPTELKQRAVESLVVVLDAEGKEVARSRMVFRDPYKRPYGLTLPVNTQIKPGETAEHRVPISIANGTIRTELHYKLYYPIEDFHPELARMLESRQIVFSDITPSEKPLESAPDVMVRTPERVAPETASPADLIDFARPPIGKVEVDIPQGDDVESVRKLIELLQFPVPEANRMATARLAELGERAIPSLIECLGSWDSKTFNQSMAALQKIGEKAIPAIVAAVGHDNLYVRFHARLLLVRMGWAGGDAVAEQRIVAALDAANAVDRASAAETIGGVKLKAGVPSLRKHLVDSDPDVVRACALSLAKLDVKEALPEIHSALARAFYPEIRRDLGKAMALLGDPAGVAVLLEGLDYPDDLIRESFFEAFFAVTGTHLGYEPLGPSEERLTALANLQRWWAQEGGADKLRHPRKVTPQKQMAAWKLVEGLSDPGNAAPPDEKTIEDLRAMGSDAVPALLIGLKYPAGFADKRRNLCSLLADAKDKDAAPALIYALRDPVISVASWAAYALGEVGDPEAVPALRRFQERIRSTMAAGPFPADAGHPDAALAVVARSRMLLGDDRAKDDLVSLLLSEDLDARQTAIDVLEARYGTKRGYDPEAPLEDRRTAVKAWES